MNHKGLKKTVEVVFLFIIKSTIKLIPDRGTF